MSCDTRKKKILKCEAIWAVLEATGKLEQLEGLCNGRQTLFSGKKEGRWVVGSRGVEV